MLLSNNTRYWFRLGLFFCSIASVSYFVFQHWNRPSLSSSCVPPQVAEGDSTSNRISRNGTTIISGKPFFPFGFYNVAWYSTTQQLIQDIQGIADAGFNTVHASAVDPMRYGTVLSQAQRLGIKVITEPGTKDLATQFRSSSSVLGWNIADDVDNGKHPIGSVNFQNRVIKSVVPQHLTYISGFTDKLPKYFFNSADVLAMQSYPINFGRENEISATYPQISLLTRALQSCGRAAYANLQAFSWSTAQPQIQGLRAPTAQEARNMTYQAIVAGTKGIIYYTYRDGSWNLPTNAPELWQGIKALVPEIKTLSPYLLDGVFTPMATGQSQVFAGWWQTQKQAILIVVNASYQPSGRVLLTLPNPSSSLKRLFQDRPKSQTRPMANQLMLIANPLDVLVYQVQLSSN